MKILIDGKNLSLFEGTGIATFTRNLIDDCKNLNHDVELLFGRKLSYTSKDFLNEIQFYDRKEFKQNKLERAINSIIDIAKKQRRINNEEFVVKETFKNQFPTDLPIWNSSSIFDRAQFFFDTINYHGTLKNFNGYDINICTSPIPIKMKNAHNIQVIHDLVPLKLPYTDLHDKKRFFKMISSIIKKSDKILTVSETSKNDLLQLFPEYKKKVHNIYQSVTLPEKYKKKNFDDVSNNLAGTYQLERDQYILFYGALEPKKNIKRMIEAYLHANVEIPLVIAGKDGWLLEEELKPLQNTFEYQTISSQRITKRQNIIRLPYVPFPNLVDLIRGAKFVFFPSVYEGFGLPIVEAMMCETPVITSKYGATAEIAGDATVLVDPYDIFEMSVAVRNATYNDLRIELSEKMRIRSAFFAPNHHQIRLQDALFSR